MGYSANITSATASVYATTELLRAHMPHSAYTDAVVHGRADRAVHPAMSPMGVRRESRDSAEHPTSLAIGVMFDVTGSMGAIPRTVQRRLVTLMSLLSTRGYVDHPQVLFGAVGDATCDGGPLQIGQFESGLDMDKDLQRVWVESGGGGGHQESYELAHYFFTRHVVTDCFDKRGKKGYLFTMGDEAPYAVVSRSAVSAVIGDTLQADIPHEEVLTELQTKWNVFHLLMETNTSRCDPNIAQRWNALLPDGHVINLRNGQNVGEVIGLVVGINEGRVSNPESDMAQLGADKASIQEVLKSLMPLARVRGIKLSD